MSSCSHGMWKDGEDCDICRLDKDQARKLKEAEARIVELERAARAAHQSWVSESNVAEAMHVLAHVLAFGTTSDSIGELERLDPNFMERVWEQTKQVIREAGEDPDDLLARAGKNVEDWRMACSYCLGKGEWQNEFLREDERKHAPSLAFLGKLQCVLGLEGLPVTYDDLLDAVRALRPDNPHPKVQHIAERARIRGIIEACPADLASRQWIMRAINSGEEVGEPVPRLDYPRAEIDALRSAARACVNARCTDRLRVAETQDALFAALTILDDILEDAPCSDSVTTPKGNGK